MSRTVHYGGPLEVRWDDYAQEWEVLREIRVSWFEGGARRATFHVAAGFRTDLSSIPSFVPAWLFPKLGPHNLPSVVHDWCYQARTGLDRAAADLLFLDGMREMGVAAWRRRAMHAAVRAFGAAPWARARGR